MSTGSHFTLRCADGGRERISLAAALGVSSEPDAYTLHLAVRRPTPTTMHADPAPARTNCGICAAELPDAPTLCYLCATPFHTSCISSSVPGLATPPPPTDGYDWFCSTCVEAHELDGSLFRSLMPLTRAQGTRSKPSHHFRRPTPSYRSRYDTSDTRSPVRWQPSPLPCRRRGHRCRSHLSCYQAQRVCTLQMATFIPVHAATLR